LYSSAAQEWNHITHQMDRGAHSNWHFQGRPLPVASPCAPAGDRVRPRDCTCTTPIPIYGLTPAMGRTVKRGGVFSFSSLFSLKAVFFFFLVFRSFRNLARLLWQCSGFNDLA